MDGAKIRIIPKVAGHHPASKLDFNKLPIDFPRSLTDGNLKFLVGFDIAGEQDNGDLVLIDSGLMANQRWKQCSYSITGSTRYATQTSYRCTTCYPLAASGLGLCSCCATDHSKQGHKVTMRPDIGESFYCDSQYLEETKTHSGNAVGPGSLVRVTMPE
jgi:hypothetical protein